MKQEKKLVDLGLMNYWGDNPPQLYLDCVKMEHYQNGIARELNTARESIYLGYVECKVCGYCYTVDAS